MFNSKFCTQIGDSICCSTFTKQLIATEHWQFIKVITLLLHLDRLIDSVQWLKPCPHTKLHWLPVTDISLLRSFCIANRSKHLLNGHANNTVNRTVCPTYYDHPFAIRFTHFQCMTSYYLKSWLIWTKQQRQNQLEDIRVLAGGEIIMVIYVRDCLTYIWMITYS